MPEHALQKQIEAEIPASVKVYANVTHWVTIASAIAALFIPILILANPGNNVLNPNLIFGAIFEGASPEDIWAIGGGFPGGHFYLENLTADGIAMMFMNLGCGVGFFALVPAVILHIRERDWFCAVLGGLLAILICLSMFGMLSIAA